MQFHQAITDISRSCHLGRWS